LEILITEEQLSELLTEAIEDYLYYYRSPRSLLTILKTNQIRASVAGLGLSDDVRDSVFNKNRLFFLSTTRNKNFVFRGRPCRIYLDRDKLKRKYKIVPFQFYKNSKLNKTEYEDRILMYDPYLVASSYIKRIDIYVKSYLVDDELKSIVELAYSHNIPLYFFDEFDKYEIGSEKYALSDFRIRIGDEIEPYKPYKLSDSELNLFFSIFYLNNDEIPIFKDINKQYMEHYKEILFYTPKQYFSDYIDLIDKMRSNSEYFEYLKFLAKKMRKYGTSDIKYLIIRKSKELSIKEYIEKGSIGDLDISESNLETLNPLEKVSGILNISFSKNLKTFGTLKEVVGYLNASNCRSLKTLANFQIAQCDVDLYNCVSLKDLGLLENVEGDLRLDGCTSLTTLDNLQTVGKSLDLDGCTSLKSIESIKEVGYSIFLKNCELLNDLGSIEEVNSNLILLNCTSLKDIGNIKKIGGVLNLTGSSIRSLGKLQEVGEYIAIGNTPLEKEFNSGQLQKKYPHLADKFIIY
jgi:hypothetical protein